MPSTRASHHVFFALMLTAALLVVFIPLPSRAAAESGERIFRVQASQFAFSPAKLQVNPGERVTIELTSTDVVHGFYIDGYDLGMQVDPGQTARLTFIADREGSFRFRCSATCGDMHPFMIGKLQVGPNTLLWRAGVLALMLSAAGMWKWRK